MIFTATIASLSLALQAQPAAEKAEEAASATASEAVENAEAAAEDQEKVYENKITCRRTAIIGSKFKKRICGTASEWETMRRRAEKTTEEFQRRGKGNEPVN